MKRMSPWRGSETGNSAWLHILDEPPVFHRADCTAHSIPDIRPNAPEGDALAPAVRDEIIAYGLAVRPAYEELRGLLGQYSGLLLLAYGSSRADYPDLDVMAMADGRLRETSERLGLVLPPAGAADHHRGLLEAARQLKRVHQDLIDGLRRTEQKEGAHRRLKMVQALLFNASDTRFAMTMVDFGSSCCCGTANP